MGKGEEEAILYLVGSFLLSLRSINVTVLNQINSPSHPFDVVTRDVNSENDMPKN